MDMLNNTPRRPVDLPLDVPAPSVDAARAALLVAQCPVAGATPLVDAPELAAIAGVGSLHIKDERNRMGLGSFKALGAAYVIAHDASDCTAKGRTYVTASAGNHGMSVAAGAAAFGARAVVYIAETVPEAFAARLRDIGAEVRREGAIYEDSMAAAMAAAEAEGFALLSDSSWDGYYDRPHRLMEGYLVLMDEAIRVGDRRQGGDDPRAGVRHGAAGLQGTVPDRVERAGAGCGCVPVDLRGRRRGRGGGLRAARGAVHTVGGCGRLGVDHRRAGAEPGTGQPRFVYPQRRA